MGGRVSSRLVWCVSALAESEIARDCNMRAGMVRLQKFIVHRLPDFMKIG